MVTGELTRTFGRFQLYNTDSQERTIGIWRYAPEGVIHPDYYLYKTKKLGPYTIDESYGYVREYYTDKATPPIWKLYRALLESIDGIAAMFVNNSYVCVVHPESLEYIDVITAEREVYRKETELLVSGMLNVGWIRTKLQCTQISMKPFRLQMDPVTGLLYAGGGNWVRPEVFPAFDETKLGYPLYKILLEQEDKSAVYLNSITGKEVYL